MDINSTLSISAAGMQSQSDRLRIIAENIANQDTVGSTPGSDPYRRKTISFENALDKINGVSTVRVKKVNQDMSDFETRYDPTNPAADKHGYVKMPNVNTMLEVVDSHEAERSYEANLNTFQTTRSMTTRTIDLLK